VQAGNDLTPLLRLFSEVSQFGVEFCSSVSRIGKKAGDISALKIEPGQAAFPLIRPYTEMD